MSILTELKKLTKKKNATVVSQALPDSLDGSGSSGGANVLTLYWGEKEVDAITFQWAYKDPELTLEYESYEEVKTAINSASSIKIYARDEENEKIAYFANMYSVSSNFETGAYVVILDGSNSERIHIWGETK